MQRLFSDSGGAESALDGRVIKRLTRTQKWKGLVTASIRKGKGVLATRQFGCGEVVCDYHGRVVSRWRMLLGSCITWSPSGPAFCLSVSMNRLESISTSSEAGLCRQMVQNYVKSVKRRSSLCFEDRVLPEDCKNYISFPSNLQVSASASEQVSKEMARERFAIVNEGSVPLTQCAAVLETANWDFLAVMGKLRGPGCSLGRQLTQVELQLVLYYLEAVVILRHLQRPGVVERVTQWVQRKSVPGHGGHVVMGVKEYKTSATQVATFDLSQEEMCFDLYFTEVHPVMLGKKRKHMEDETDESVERFFISSTGSSIYNASNDVERLHRKCRRWQARRAFETATNNMTDIEKFMVADYLTHSSATAENVVMASLLLKRLLSVSE
ncbi:hypothetical protein AOLI_G00328470 [Acnodon oligacanthus]